MVVNDKRYADLSHSVRAFLETLDDEGVTNLSAMAHLYERLSLPKDGRISPMDFLLNANPRTLEWLKDARKEEIDQLDEAIRLVRSSRTVGKFMRWVIGVTVGAFIIMAQFGESIAKFVNFFRGVGK